MLSTNSKHLLLDLWDCQDRELLDNPERLELVFRRAAQIMRVCVVSGASHKFAPTGASGVLVITESHMSWHTWPDLGYIAIDFFTCGDKDPMDGIEYIKSVFEPKKTDALYLQRGNQEDNFKKIEKIS